MIEEATLVKAIVPRGYSVILFRKTTETAAAPVSIPATSRLRAIMTTLPFLSWKRPVS